MLKKLVLAGATAGMILTAGSTLFATSAEARHWHHGGWHHGWHHGWHNCFWKHRHHHAWRVCR
jgi:Spy/CpxP family protein refolding chaperone